jgi:hypothetical protein
VKLSSRHKFIVISFILCSIILICGAELIARLVGIKPIHPAHFANEPIVHIPDPVLGWRNNPGSYNYPAYVSGYDNIQITILPSGERATKPESKKINANKIIMIGCSFTQGWAVSDQDTFAWKLQDLNPHVDVRNYGASGYSTYQSFLNLQHILPLMQNPKTVIYGFMDDHENRNVAPDYWLKALTGVKRSQSAVPYLSLSSDENMQTHLPKKYQAFLLRTRLASIVGLENVYARIKDFKQIKRLQQKSIITKKIIIDMHILSKKYGADFYMVVLHDNAKITKYYQDNLSVAGVNVVDCTQKNTNKMQVPGENHPSGELHSLWAECIDRNVNL